MIKIAVSKFSDNQFLVLRISNKKGWEIKVLSVFSTLIAALKYKRTAEFIMKNVDIQFEKIRKELKDDRLN